VYKKYGETKGEIMGNISLTDIGLSFEPIPDDKSFKDIEADNDYDSKWVNEVIDIIKERCPRFNPWTIPAYVTVFDDEDNKVCIQMTTATHMLEGEDFEDEVKDFLKKRFPKSEVNVDSTEYNHSEDDEDTLELFDSYKEYKDKEKAGYVSVDMEDEEIKEWYKNN
jgi:hypothetical protein